MPDIVGYLQTKMTDYLYSLNKYDTSQYNNLPTSTVADDELYFVAVYEDETETLPFQFVPDTISVSRQAELAAMKILMRNVPKYKFTGGQTTLKITLDFYSEWEHRRDVMERVQKVESWAYADGYDEAPPLILLVWGELFEDVEWKVTSVETSYSNFNKEYGYLPQQAYVSINLVRVSEENIIK